MNKLTGNIKNLFDKFSAKCAGEFDIVRFETTYGFLCISKTSDERFEYYAATEGCEAHALITVGDMIKGEAR